LSLNRPEGFSYARGEIPDDETYLVPHVLECSELVEKDGVAKVKVGGGGVNSSFTRRGFPELSFCFSSFSDIISTVPLLIFASIFSIVPILLQ